MLVRAAVLAAGLLAFAPPAAQAAAVQVTIEVPPGKTKTVRLRKLTKGVVMAVSIRADRALRIALVSAAALKSAKPEALFRAAVDRSLTFRVVVPETSDYYLVLDNRRGTEAVRTTATIRAQKRAGPSKPPPAKDGNMNETRAVLPPRA